MFCERKVVVVIPAGRKPYLEVLLPYLVRETVIDEIRFWLNSYDDNDRQYIREVVAGNPLFTLEEHDIEVDRLGWGWSIYPFFRNCCDPNTIYVRIDDDVVWIDSEAIKKLLDFRLTHPEYFLVYANIVNNPITSHIHQRMGAMPTTAGICGYDACDPIGWENVDSWESCHRNFLDRFSKDQLLPFFFDRWELLSREKMPVNFVSWLGKEFSEFDGEVPVNEEEFLAINGPVRAGKINCVCGSALVSHGAFWKQRLQIFQKYDVKDEFGTEIYRSYRKLVLGEEPIPVADLFANFTVIA